MPHPVTRRRGERISPKHEIAHPRHVSGAHCPASPKGHRVCVIEQKIARARSGTDIITQDTIDGTPGGGADVQTDETPRENHMREATGVGAEGGQFTVQTVAWADQMRDLGAREGAGTYKCQR